MPHPSSTAIVARNTIFQFIGKGITMALSMVSLALIAGSLSPAQFGEFSIIFSVIFITAVSLTEIKVEQVVVRDMAADHQQYNLLISQSSILKGLFSLAVIVGVAIWIFLADYSSLVKSAAYISLIGVLFSAIQSGFYSAILFHLKAYLLTAAEVIAKFITTLITVILVWLLTSGQLSPDPATTLLALTATILPAIIIFICFAYWAIGSLQVKVDLRPDWPTINRLLRESWPLWLMGVLIVIHYQAGYILLSHFNSEEDLAIFALARRFMEVLITLPPLFLASIYPLLSRYVAEDPARLRQVVQKSLDFLVTAIAIIAVITFYAAPQIITLFGEGQYPQSIAVLQILTLAIFSNFIYGLFYSYMVANRQQRQVIFMLIAAIVLNLSLNFWLLAQLQYATPAIAAAISETALLVGLFLLVRRHLGQPLSLRTPVKALVLALIILVLLSLSQLNHLVADSLLLNFLYLSLIAIIALSLYGLLALWTKLLPPDIIEHSLSLLPLPESLKKRLAGRNDL